MANKIVGITIDIEGKTSGLTKSLQEANSAISKTSAALKDIDKALQLDPTNVDLIAQKEALLTKQIEQTNDKLEIMQQVATDANAALERGDISQEQYAQLTAEIAKTDVALAELEEEANGSADSMEDLGDGAEDSADSVGEVAAESGNAGTALDALGAIAAATGAAMAAAMATAVAAAKEVTEALASATMETSAYADEMLTLSSTTGLSTETLQELTYASELLDVSVDTITGSMTKMEKSMASSADKYEELGVAVTNADGSFRSAEDVFWDTIDALGNIEDPVQRDLAAMELMGKSAKELNPLIDAGSESFRALAEEAHETGYVMSDEALGAFGAFDDQMQRLNNATDNAQHALGGVLLPILGDLAGEGTDLLNEFSKGISESGGDIDKMAEVISEMLPKVINALLKQIPKIVGMISKMTGTIIDTIVQNLPLILDAAMQIVDVLVTTLLTPDNITKIINSALQIIMTLVNYLIQNLPLIVDAAIQIIVALIQGLTEALPELIPAIVEALVTIVNALIDNLPLLLDATLQLILAVAGAILDNLPEIISAVFEVINRIIDFLLSPDGIGAIAETGYKVLVALVEKLPDALVEIIKGITDVIDNILAAFGFEGGLGKGLTEIWNGIWDMIKGVINTIIGGINGMISAVESAINFVIDCINSLSWDVPDWVPLIGGSTFGFDVPHVSMWKIPELAQGAVIPPNNPFLAVLGDQSSGTNIEAPLETIKQALLEAMGGGNQQIIIPVYIGQERLDTVVAQANKNNTFLSGGH